MCTITTGNHEHEHHLSTMLAVILFGMHVVAAAPYDCHHSPSQTQHPLHEAPLLPPSAQGVHPFSGANSLSVRHQDQYSRQAIFNQNANLFQQNPLLQRVSLLHGGPSSDQYDISQNQAFYQQASPLQHGPSSLAAGFSREASETYAGSYPHQPHLFQKAYTSHGNQYLHQPTLNTPYSQKSYLSHQDQQLSLFNSQFSQKGYLPHQDAFLRQEAFSHHGSYPHNPHLSHTATRSQHGSLGFTVPNDSLHHRPTASIHHSDFQPQLFKTASASHLDTHATTKPVFRDFPHRGPHDGSYLSQSGDAVVRESGDNDFDGNFHYDFETENGIAADATGALKHLGPEQKAQLIEGSYSYTSPEGQVITTSYVADENGFVPSGDHLSPLIAKSLAYTRGQPPQPENQQ